MTPAPYVVAVRELCEFAAKAGDLDLRFTPSPTADEGMAGHQIVAARRRAPGYRRELALEGRHGELLVRGRADGYDEAAGVLEEVKTFKGDLARMPANQRALHRAQARVYAALLCARDGLPALTVRLVYFDIDSAQETTLDERCAAADLAAFLADHCERFLGWARAQLAHRGARDEALQALRFVHPTFRDGQRMLAENAYRAARLGRCLMAQAGTGIGKTVGTLFPLLKAMPSQRLDKLFFLSAKGSGHAAPLEALAQLGAGSSRTPLRVLQLVARDKACEHPDKACHGESCPLARGFYDRLPAARREAVDGFDMSRAALRRVALAHGVCPYYLAQELVRWADVVVGDYNYFFDGSALLHALTALNEWRVALLADEAHNLVERARAMYSAGLSRDALRDAASAAPAALAPPLKSLQRAWGAAAKGQSAPYAAHAEVPARLVKAARNACDAIAAHAAAEPDGLDARVSEFGFELMRFARLAEAFGSHSIFDVAMERGPRHSVLGIRNVVPAPFLAPRFAAAHASVLFSATLSPPRFYADTLGLPEDAAWLDVDAPFAAAQLEVNVVADVSTRFARRAQSAPAIARIIAAQFARRPGNYLAFFSSFDYLRMVLDALRAQHPDVPAWEQARRMSDAEKDAFLARFVEGGAGVGFAVLGGSFAEGVDLPGERLVGAFVATLGLPQLNPVNEEFRRALHASFGAGFEYAYLYPGLRKVVQAAGRVIRTPSDTGTLYLIDERFARADVRELLPSWWRPRRTMAAAAGTA